MKYLIVASLFFVISVSGIAQEAKVKKCRSDVKGGKYKLVSEGRGIKGEGPLLVIIVVNPKNINREDMIQLARRLKSEYCNDEKLIAEFFDNRKYANPYSFMDYVNSGGKINWARGYYSFDRSSGKDLLEFSSKLGNPTTENMVDLNFEK